MTLVIEIKNTLKLSFQSKFELKPFVYVTKQKLHYNYTI